MKQLFAKKEVSDHILIDAFPTAKEKGEICILGSLIGISDYKTEANKPGSIDIGKMAAVFQAKTSDITGTPAIGTDVYITPAGDISTTAADNKLFGTVVIVGSNTVDFAVIG
jgi:hypothetical protein